MKITDDKPMMAQHEIDWIDQYFIKSKPQVCLEWGSGSSTTYFSKHQNVTSWLSIEHDGHYVSYLKDKLNDRTHVIWCNDAVFYIDCVKLLGRRFDFILIDGLEREACVKTARDLIKEDGIILLHDSGRADLQDIIKLYNGEIIFEGEDPYQGHYKHRGLARFTI